MKSAHVLEQRLPPPEGVATALRTVPPPPPPKKASIAQTIPPPVPPRRRKISLPVQQTVRKQPLVTFSALSIDKEAPEPGKSVADVRSGLVSAKKCLVVDDRRSLGSKLDELFQDSTSESCPPNRLNKGDDLRERLLALLRPDSLQRLGSDSKTCSDELQPNLRRCCRGSSPNLSKLPLSLPLTESPLRKFNVAPPAVTPDKELTNSLKFCRQKSMPSLNGSGEKFKSAGEEMHEDSPSTVAAEPPSENNSVDHPLTVVADLNFYEPDAETDIWLPRNPPMAPPKGPQITAKSPQIPPRSPQITATSPQIPAKSPLIVRRGPRVPPKLCSTPRGYLAEESASPRELDEFFDSMGIDSSLREYGEHCQLSASVSFSSVPSSVCQQKSDDLSLEEPLGAPKAKSISIIEKNARVIKWIYSCDRV